MWGVTPAILISVTRLLKPSEDEVAQHYAVKTIENVSSQGGEWAARFATQDVAYNLVQVGGAASRTCSVDGVSAVSLIPARLVVWHCKSHLMYCAHNISLATIGHEPPCCVYMPSLCHAVSCSTISFANQTYSGCNLQPQLMHAGKSEGLKSTAASTLSRLMRSSPALVNHVVDKFGVRLFLSGLNDNSSKVTTAWLGCLTCGFAALQYHVACLAIYQHVFSKFA